VKLAAHAALEGGINHLVLGDAGFAGEGGRPDGRFIVVTVACQILDVDVGVWEGFPQEGLEVGSRHGHRIILKKLRFQLFYPVVHGIARRFRELHDDHESFDCDPERCSGIRASLGDGRSEKIAHCVGDVDKITLSENLGASANRRRERRPQIAAAPRGAWWEDAKTGFMTGSNQAQPITVIRRNPHRGDPKRTQERDGVANSEFRAGTKGRP